MDNTDNRYLKKTFKVEQETMFRSSKLQSIEKMQWLKNTSYSPDFGKKSVSKKIYFDTNTEIVDAVLLKDNTCKAYPAKESDKYHITDKCTETLSNDLVAKSNENIQKADIDIITLISNRNKVIDQKKEEILSIVESIVTAQVEAEFSIDKKQIEPPNMSQNNESIIEPQTPNHELASIKSDGNNNSTSVTPLSKEDNKEKKAPCKVSEAESTKSPMEAKNKDVQRQSGSASKMSVKNKGNTTKSGEKPSLPGASFRKTINTAKSPPDRFKTVKSHDCVRRQQSVKCEKETKNSTPKSSVEKKNCEIESNKTADAGSQSKTINKDKAMPRQHHAVSKQFVSKLKEQESLEKSTPTVEQAVDKNKKPEITPLKQEEKATQLKVSNLSPNGSETKERRTIDEKIYQNGRKVTGGGNVRKSGTFFLQYKNSSYSRASQDVPRNADESATSYRKRNSLPYTPDNPRIDRFNSGNTQRRAIVKKEYTGEYYKSSSRVGERNANSIGSCEKRQDETYLDNQNQSNQMKSESKNPESSSGHEAAASNDERNTKTKTDSKETENSDNANDENAELVTTSEQREKVDKGSEVDATQENVQVNKKNEETNLHSVNSHSNKFAVESRGGAQNEQLSKVENVEYAKNTQYVSKQTTWSNQTFENTVERNVAMSVQQSVQNMQYSSQQTQERNKLKSSYQPHALSWEPSCDKVQQQFPNNTMQYSQAPDTFDTTQYEYNVQAAALCDDGAVNPPTLIPMIGVNVENPNVLYRYESNIQQRPVTASSNFSGLSPQMDEAGRWNPSVHNRHLYVHVDQSYNSTLTQHTYNSPDQQSCTSTPEHSMHVYNADLNEMYNAQATNCVSQPIIYAPSPCMQPWNPQLQYSIPVFYASPCASYTMVPATVNQLNNFDNIGPAHDQFKYVPYSRTNNYAKDPHEDANNCAVQMRNTAGNIKSNQYYKQCRDNCRFVHDVPQYATSMSYSRSQDTNWAPATGAMRQCNTYRSISQRYPRQSATMSANLKRQIQDLGCDDKDSEDIPPIISPKEFVTKSGFTPQACNQEFKNSNVGYHVPQLQRYNGMRRNSSYRNFSREYTSSVSVGRGKK